MHYTNYFSKLKSELKKFKLINFFFSIYKRIILVLSLKHISIVHANYFWHYNVSVFLAKYIYWIFYPLLFFLKNRYRFAINLIPDAVGHCYTEIDYLFRKIYMSKELSSKKIIVIWPKTETNQIFKFFRKHNQIKFIFNGFLEIIIYPFLIRYPEITINASLSSLNYGINKRSLSPKEVYQRIDLGNQAKKKTMHFLPYKEFLSIHQNAELFKQLEIKKKYVVLQIKTKAANATFSPVNVNTYLKVIEDIQHKDMQILFMGRENMPTIFKKFCIINYAESKYTNSINDFILVKNAHAVISSASGFNEIATQINVPQLILNNWNYLYAQGEYNLVYPSKLILNDSALTISEQINYGLNYYNVKNNFLIKSIDINEEEMLNTWLELEDRISQNNFKPSIRQLNFKEKFSKLANIIDNPSNIAETFIKKNIELIR